MAEELDVSKSVVVHILAGNSWTEISKDYVFPNKRQTDEKLIITICELLQDGFSPKEISIKLNIKKPFIQHIASRETHTDISKNYTFNYDKFKIKDEVIHNICKDLASSEYFSIKDLSKKHNVSESFIKGIKYRKHRNDISCNYVF